MSDFRFPPSSRAVEKWQCSHRIFGADNSSDFSPQLYLIETGLHEMLAQSPHRTLVPEEADFFYVPVSPTSCALSVCPSLHLTPFITVSLVVCPRSDQQAQHPSFLPEE